ncbi:MAG: hypothetical protein C4293_05090 [Nitrospiraceae bacterium]
MEDNPALFFRGTSMTIRLSAFTVLLLSSDPDLQVQLKQDLKDSAITVAKDIATASRTAAKRPFDVVLIEAERGVLDEISTAYRTIDPSRTIILAGSRSMLRQACGFVQSLRDLQGRSNGAGQNLSLEAYIESKIGDLVKGMKSSAGRNLHPMLIKAVERPLITFALRETNGNQIQAAHLLGMNRNTLRKKMTELRISVKREKAVKA